MLHYYNTHTSTYFVICPKMRVQKAVSLYIILGSLLTLC